MPIELVENKSLQPGQCHAAGCKDTARQSAVRIFKDKGGCLQTRPMANQKARRNKMLFCRNHRHLRNQMSKEMLRSIGSTQAVKVVSKV